MAASVQATKKSCISLFDCFISFQKIGFSYLFFIYLVYNITCNCFTKK